MYSIHGYTTAKKGFESAAGRQLRILRTLVYDMSQADFAKYKLGGLSASALSKMELGRIPLSKAALELLRSNGVEPELN